MPCSRILSNISNLSQSHVRRGRNRWPCSAKCSGSHARLWWCGGNTIANFHGCYFGVFLRVHRCLFDLYLRHLSDLLQSQGQRQDAYQHVSRMRCSLCHPTSLFLYCALLYVQLLCPIFVLQLIVSDIGISMGYLYLMMGVIISSAVLPATLTLMWSGQNLPAVTLSPILGLACSLIAWLVTAKTQSGELSVASTGAKYVLFPSPPFPPSKTQFLSPNLGPLRSALHTASLETSKQITSLRTCN